VIHEKRIEIRWKDLDVYGHVNNAVYLTYLEEVRDEWLGAVLGDPAEIWSYVLVRVAIDYRRELSLDDDVVIATCRLRSMGTSSVRTEERVLTVHGEVAAEAESVLVARDADDGRSRPLTDAERAAFERAVPAHIRP
jgi:acyl-CoA thioester hydrolase